MDGNRPSILNPRGQMSRDFAKALAVVRHFTVRDLKTDEF